MTLDELSTAAAEGLAVCLACGTAQDRPAFSDEGCVACVGFDVIPAATILQCAQFVSAILEEREASRD